MRSRMIAGVIAAILVLSTVPLRASSPALANDGITTTAQHVVTQIATEEAAIARVRQLMPVDPSLTDIKARLTDGVWNLTMRAPDPKGRPQVATASLRAADGELLSYMASMSRKVKAGPFRPLSLAEAQVIANDLLRKVNPAHAGSIVPSGCSNNRMGSGDILYGCKYVRQHFGRPVAGDGITVTISAVDGVVTGYHYAWNERLTFPAGPAPLDAAQAARAYWEHGNWRMGYALQSNTIDQQAPLLVYSSWLPFAQVMDAATGEFLRPDEGTTAPPVMLPVPAAGPAFNLKLPLDAAGAESHVRNLLPLGEMKLVGVPQLEQGTWTFNFAPEAEEEAAAAGAPEGILAEVKVRAADGQILRALLPGKSATDGQEHTPLSYADLAQKATEVASALFGPDAVNWQPLLMPQQLQSAYLNRMPIYLDYTDELDPQVLFAYDRVQNGYWVHDYHTIITLSIRTGQVQTFETDGSPTARFDASLFMPPASLPTSDQAFEAWVKSSPLELIYQMNPAAPDQAQLVWQPRAAIPLISLPELQVIDGGVPHGVVEPAQSGEGPAAGAIDILSGMGVLLDGGAARPAEAITQGEGLQILLMTPFVMPNSVLEYRPATMDRTRADAVAHLTAAAQKAGLLDGLQFSADAPLTRTAFARLAAKLLAGRATADKAADADQIPADARDSFAQMIHLGVLTPQGGKGLPQAVMTRQDLAVAAVRLAVLLSRP